MEEAGKARPRWRWYVTGIGDIDLYLGLDVGKGEHHATALTAAGRRVFDRRSLRAATVSIMVRACCRGILAFVQVRAVGRVGLELTTYGLRAFTLPMVLVENTSRLIMKVRNVVLRLTNLLATVWVGTGVPRAAGIGGTNASLPRLIAVP